MNGPTPPTAGTTANLPSRGGDVLSGEPPGPAGAAGIENVFAGFGGAKAGRAVCSVPCATCGSATRTITGRLAISPLIARNTQVVAPRVTMHTSEYAWPSA